MRQLLLYVCLGFSLCLSAADACRYHSLEGQYGNTLLNNLHKLISPHTKLIYDNVRADRAGVDIVDKKVVDMYSSCSFSSGNYCRSSSGYDACKCYNREHLLPKSWWGSTGSSDTTGMYTDLFNVVPADYEANTTRSAWIYDEVSGTPTWTNGASKLGTSKHFSNPGSVFEPADEYKGDIARAYFYMITCYSDRNFTQGGKGFKFFQSGTAKLNPTARDLLLSWHRKDPVSDRERNRNNAVEKKQGNRNPFIDDPSLVEHIWGNKKTTAYVCSTTDFTETPSTSSSVRKILMNGQLYLYHQGVYYNPQGQPVTTNIQSSIFNE